MSQPAEVSNERASTTSNTLRVSGMNQLQTCPGKRILTLNCRKVAGLQGKPWLRLTAVYGALCRVGAPVVHAPLQLGNQVIDVRRRNRAPHTGFKKWPSCSLFS